jgi:flagellin-like hook-associated protein FlgL
LTESDAALTDAFTRAASGRRLRSPSEDFAGYRRSLGLRSTIEDYRVIKQNLLATKAYSAKAVEVGGALYEDVAKLRELAERYNRHTDGSDERTSAAAEFEALKSAIVRALDTNGDVVTTGVIATVDLDPGTAAATFEIRFASAPSHLPLASDITGLTTLTGTAAPGAIAATALGTLDEVVAKAAKFLVGARHMDTAIDRQATIVGTTIGVEQQALAQLTDIDDAEAMTRVVQTYIRREAALSMLAQGNTDRAAVSRLYEAEES